MFCSQVYLSPMINISFSSTESVQIGITEIKLAVFTRSFDLNMAAYHCRLHLMWANIIINMSEVHLKKLVEPVIITLHLSCMPTWSAEDQVSQRTPEVIVSNRGNEVRDVCLYTPCYCVLHTAVRMLSCQWNAENVAVCIFESKEL